MKKFALAAVAAAALTGGVAQAYTVGTYSNGFVVPNVVFNNATDTTAVGIINRAGSAVPVFWVFHDENSGHVTDGCFGLTDNQYMGLGWGLNNGGQFDMSGAGLEGKRGYLVFAVGNVSAGTAAANACAASDGTLAAPAGQLSANAFQVSVTNGGDAAVVPVIDGPLGIVAGADLTTLGATSLTSVGGALTGAAAATDVITARYVTGTSGSTRVTVWSTGDQSGTHTVNVFDNAQNRRSANFVLSNTELDYYDPATIVGKPASYTDGFIEWKPFATVPAGKSTTTALAAIGGSVFVYSEVTLPTYNAVQTLLGAHK